MELFKSGEDYLERILILRAKIGVVRSIDIVNDMHFSKPSVSIAMKKLKESDFISISQEGFITLTEKGEEVASKIYERHVLLTEWLLSLGVDEKTAREDACKIEHDLSSQTFDAIKKYLKK
ncbi:MAG TPA: metal-dependent transcriptional regulator [Bacilli bacterium]|nr:metal-dependent transcriptional regulator [Bacilli bacterium]HPS18516.1 metal-dependent transcriptional regulator [Bacilli bacterium]